MQTSDEIVGPPAPEDMLASGEAAQPAVPAFAQNLQLQQDTPPPVRPAWQQQAPMASVFIVLGAGLVAWSLWQRRRIAKRLETREAASVLSATDALAGQRRELERLQRDLHELSGRLAQQLDAKAATLEGLLVAADERIARLERLEAATPARAAVQVEPKARAPLAGLDHSTGAHAEVHALADQGLSPVEIAQRLGRPTGQVELILNLRKVSLV